SEILSIFQNSGLIDLDGSLEPLHLKIDRHENAKTLMVNGCESEPYVTAEHALMMSHPMEILKGAEMIRKAMNLDRLVIALEENKREIAELFKSKIFFLKWKHAEVKVFPSQYPQGDSEVLARGWMRET